MAQRIEIKCINKSDRYNPHERITHVGGGTEATRWRETQQQTIAYIEAGTWDYFVNVNNNPVDVIVARHNGNKYIKTRNDGDQPNNLLSLPECPK